MADHVHDQYCGCPSIEVVDHQVQEDIKRVGWHCLIVTGSPDTPPYAYTIGLEETCGHPELVLCGLAPEQAHGIMQIAVQRIQSGETIGDGDERDDIVQGLPVRFKAVAEAEVRGCFTVSDRYFHRHVARLQIVWPDPEGRFPGEGCNERMALVQDLELALHS